jgi:hypothetical protein
MPEEQQTETATEQTQPSDVATRDELIEAVRAAGGTQSVDVAAEEQQAAEAAAAGTTPEAPATENAPEDPEAKFEAILAKRRENHQELSGAKARAERMLREAEEAKQRRIEEARAEARRAAEEERERLRLNFRKSPTETLRALDDDPNYVADTVLREGTPEAREAARIREELRETKEAAKLGSAALEELKKFRQEQFAEKHAAQQAQVRHEYLSQFATPEKTPYLHARWEPEEIFQRSVALAHQWAQEGLEYKKDFDDNTVAEYLEHQSRKRISALSGTPANQVPAGAPAKGPGIATKVTANAPRTLSAAAGSERRTSPRPLHEMAPEEQRKALIEEVAAARRANPDATS